MGALYGAPVKSGENGRWKARYPHPAQEERMPLRSFCESPGERVCHEHPLEFSAFPTSTSVMPMSGGA